MRYIGQRCGRREYAAGEFPDSTQIEVADLGIPGLKIQIETIAVLPN